MNAMRTVSGRLRERQGDQPWTRQVAPCTGVNHHVHVAVQRPHTKEFPQEARDVLGLAVIRAREALGLPQRTFAMTARIGRTSLFKLENGIGVGAVVHEAVGRALPGWTEDTPLSILEGDEPPPLATGLAGEPELATEPSSDDYSESSIGFPVGSDEWIMHYSEFPEVVRAGLEVRRKRRELQGLMALIAEREAKIAEGALPHGSGERS